MNSRLKKYKNIFYANILLLIFVSVYLFQKNETNFPEPSKYSSLETHDSYKCLNPRKQSKNLYPVFSGIYFNQTKNEVLIETQSNTTSLFNSLLKILISTRIKYKISNEIEKLVSNQTALVIFHDYHDYVDAWKNSTFISYLVANEIGVIVFNRGNDVVEIADCKLNDENFMENFLFVTRFNTQSIKINKKLTHNSQFKSMFFNDQSMAIIKCETSGGEPIPALFLNVVNQVKHVFFNLNSFNEIWLLKLLFIDSLRYLTNGIVDFGLKRFVQIDIDELFYSLTGTRMEPDDVVELSRLQEELSNNYFQQTFKFNLGFSGAFYQADNKADQLFIGKESFFFLNILLNLYV